MQWFNNLRLSAKLIGAFVILAAIVALVGNIGRTTSDELGERVHAMKTDVVDAIIYLGDVDREMQLYRGDVWKYLALPADTDKAATLREVEARPASIESMFRKYSQTQAFPGEGEARQDFLTAWSQIVAIRTRAVSLAQSNPAEAARVLLVLGLE